MAKLLMNLRGVLDDEADEVRALLGEHGVDFYETPPNRWGISNGGIWLNDDAAYPQAKQLLKRYQRERSERVRAEHEGLRRRGELETLFQRVTREPLRSLLYVVLIAVVLALMTVPFVYLVIGG